MKKSSDPVASSSAVAAASSSTSSESSSSSGDEKIAELPPAPAEKRKAGNGDAKVVPKKKLKKTM